MPKGSARNSSKRHCPGDTCLLMPWVTLPYPNFMAHSRYSPATLRSPLSSGTRIPPQLDLWRERPQVRTSPWLKPGKWPKTARNGPPGLPISYLDSGPFSGHRGAIRPAFQIRNGPKWPKMARKSKKLHYLCIPKANGNSLTGSVSVPYSVVGRQES